MDNRDISRIFHTVADLYEVMGENSFRVSSYRKGAERVESLGTELLLIYEEKGTVGITALHGIGKGLAGKIVELVTTGRCASVEELLLKTPPGISDILSLNGMGPKKTGILYRELGIDSLKKLERAAAEEKLQLLPGFALKSEQKILEAIKAKRVFDAVIRLSIGKKYAFELTERLEKLPGVSAVTPTGELRRWKESIEQIELLVITTEPQTVAEALFECGLLTDVLISPRTKGRLLTITGSVADGLKVIIRVGAPVESAAALLCSTGTAVFIKALQSRALKDGFELNEHGLYTTAEKKYITYATEEEVFKSLDLPYIAPELRESSEVIERAAAGVLPVLIEQGDIKGDLHCHTRASDGANTVEEMAFAAMELGYEYISITDHSRTLSVAHGLDSIRLEKQIEEIDAYNRKLSECGNSFRVLKGTEVDILGNGTLDHPDELLGRLDIVVAAIHSGFGMDKARMTARVISAIESGRVNIIAHPTGRLIGMRSAFALDIDAVLDAAKEYSVAMEVNSYPERLDLKDLHLRRAKERGVKVAISTDAHATNQFGNIEYGIHTARRGFIEKSDVINCLGLNELMLFLKKESCF